MTRGMTAAGALERARDLAACSSPIAMARRLDHTFATRAHGELISRALVSVDRGDADRVLITLPPQVGKSQTAVIWGGFWWLVNHPDQRIMIASYAASLATRHGRHIRRLIREHGHRFGIALERGAQAADDFWTTAGGGVRCVGVDGGATGHNARAVFADDLLKGRKEAESLIQRDNVDDFWSSSLGTRLAPGAPMIMTTTLWHHDDQAARLIAREGNRADGGRWWVLRCPAFADSPDDPLGREIGEPLTHPLIPEGDAEALRAHWEDARSTRSVRDWHALYMCDPRPVEGALISEAMLRERRCFTDLPQQTAAAVAVDPTGGGSDTCGIIGGWLGADNRMYVCEDATAVLDVEVWPRTVCEVAARIGAARIVVETDFAGKLGPYVIRTAWEAMRREWEAEHADVPEAERGRNPYARFCPYLVRKRAAEMGNKLTRAEPVAQQIIEDRIRFAKYMPELESEWATLQAMKESPGRVDAMVWLAYDLLRSPAKQQPSAQPVASVDIRQVQRNPGQTGGIVGRRIIRPD